jgi:hypothetical protein
MQGEPSEVRLAIENQKHTSHKETRTNILDLQSSTKHKSRTNL